MMFNPSPCPVAFPPPAQHKLICLDKVADGAFCLELKANRELFTSQLLIRSFSNTCLSQKLLV